MAKFARLVRPIPSEHSRLETIIVLENNEDGALLITHLEGTRQMQLIRQSDYEFDLLKMFSKADEIELDDALISSIKQHFEEHKLLTERIMKLGLFAKKDPKKSPA